MVLLSNPKILFCRRFQILEFSHEEFIFWALMHFWTCWPWCLYWLVSPHWFTWLCVFVQHWTCVYSLMIAFVFDFAPNDILGCHCLDVYSSLIYCCFGHVLVLYHLDIVIGVPFLIVVIILCDNVDRVGRELHMKFTFIFFSIIGYRLTSIH